MSRKKHKKRHSSTVSAARAKLRDEQLAEDKARYGNRMNPTARNLLLFDLAFLALSQLLYMNHVINDVISAVCSLAGVARLVIALWFQFSKKDSSGGPGNWPPMR